MKLTIFGCGYSGKAIAREAKGEFETISGTTRSADKADVAGKMPSLPSKPSICTAIDAKADK